MNTDDLGLTDDDVEELLAEVRAELQSMTASERRITVQSRESFLSWLYNAIANIASLIGEIVSAPIKAILSFLAGLFEGVFRF